MGSESGIIRGKRDHDSARGEQVFLENFENLFLPFDMLEHVMENDDIEPLSGKRLRIGIDISDANLDSSLPCHIPCQLDIGEFAVEPFANHTGVGHGADASAVSASHVEDFGPFDADS